MAKDKRHPISTDMNDMDLNDAGAMTDQEREQLQMSMPGMKQKSNKRKKSM